MGFAGIVVNNESQAMDRIFTYRIPEGMKVSVGSRVKVPFGASNKRLDGFVVEIMTDADVRGIKDISSVLPGTLFGSWTVEVVEEMRRRYLSTYLEGIRLFIPVGTLKGADFKTEEKLYPKASLEGKLNKEPYISIADLISKNPGKFIRADISRMGFSASSLNTLIRHGIIEVSSVKSSRHDGRDYESYAAPNLNEEQVRASDTIMANPGTYLIHGITGSGKTEIFMDVIKRMLMEGKDSIVLVPEISLTPQMIERFKGRFGKDISIFHSRLSEGERFDEWHRVKNGEVKIAVGARSALFLPFKDLGLIVVDEEHETSYKSEMSPKYSAVEMAEFMMKRKGGRLVLASATPSIASYHRAVTGEIGLITLDKRATKGTLPQMTAVDMRNELKAGNRTMFSRVLREEIEKALSAKEQVILFLNRRGYSTFVSCRSCGHVFNCPNCSVSLTYHTTRDLSCHHCGYRQALPETCPSCSSRYIKQFGTGTEKVEEMVRKEFPGARVVRMDRDTAKNKTDYEDMYNSFKNREGDILIGTQMITKGLDFRNVTLVGIIAADLSLNLPDFRAGERTFQLITQVAGRAGRHDKPGKVVIQSYTPEDPSIVSAREHDYRGFYRREIAAREMMNNPPFSRIMSIVQSSEDESLLIKNIQTVGAELRKFLFGCDKIIILGPSPCLISKIKQNHRWQILLKGELDPDIARRIKDLVLEKSIKDVRTSIDLDPTSML